MAATNDSEQATVPGSGSSSRELPVLKVPYQRPQFVVLQLVALLLLGSLVYVDLTLMKSASSELPYEDLTYYSRETYAVIGFILGFALVAHARLSFDNKRTIKLGILLFLLGCLVLLVLPLLEAFLPFSIPQELQDTNTGIVMIFEEVFYYIGGLLLFSLIPIAGVYGILQADKRGITVSLLSLFSSLLTVGELKLFEDDIVNVFLDTSKYTIFSLLFLAYAETGFAIGHFNERYEELFRYDLNSAQSFATVDSFQTRYGMSLPSYSEDHAVSQMNGVLLIFLPFLGFMVALSLVFTILSVNFDFLFSVFMSEAYQDSIVADTIFGKVFFVLFFFTTLLVLRGIMPARTVGAKKLKMAARDDKAFIPPPPPGM